MPSRNVIEKASAADWQTFLAWAQEEGWRVPQREIQLFRDEGLGTALVLREAGTLSGFVTCMPHRVSGWIGNLLVPKPCRNAGRGRQLFTAALEQLEADGCRHIWLTASELGRPLYEQFGFATVGKTQRLVRPAGEMTRVCRPFWPGVDPLLCDRLIWGEPRSALLTALTREGRWCTAGDTVLLLQQEPGMQILGPWYRGRNSSSAASSVLDQVLAIADQRSELVCDLVDDPPERLLLAASGFRSCGTNLLMVRGGVGPVRLSETVALATLGSCG